MKLGILGSGQLAMLLQQGAKKIGIAVEIFSGNFSDLSELKKFCEKCDRITYENENIPLETLKSCIVNANQMYPSFQVLNTVSERRLQKEFLEQLKIPVAPFVAISNESELREKSCELGFPGIFKTSRFGYDGKGQLRVDSSKELSTVWESLGKVSLVYEKVINFDRELSLIACRSPQGQSVFYPLGENIHSEGILRETIAPAPQLTQKLQDLAQSFARKIFSAWNYEGVLAIELFQVGDSLLVNEVASRVHNTGHWTLDGAETSQFENHLRAGMGLSLGSTQTKGFSMMFNLIGELPCLDKIKKEAPQTRVYVYGKEPRPKRKLGHLNVVADTESLLKTRRKEIKVLLAMNSPEKPV